MTAQLSPDIPRPKPGPFIQLMGEAFLLLGRYFVVVYPIFLYFILRSLVTHQALPNYRHWEWWVVTIGFIAIWFLFEGGWHAMTFQAVELHEKQRTEPPPPDVPLEIVFPFALLRAFIPGIGEYGARFLTGGFLNILLFALPGALVLWLGYRMIGIPKVVLPFLTAPELNSQQMQQAFMAASPHEQIQLAMWDGIFWALLLIIFLVTLLTMYWRPYVLIKQIRPPMAFWKSALFVFTHPLLTLQIMALSVFLGLAAGMLASLSAWTAFIGFFLLLLTLLFMQFLLYLILYRTDGPQHPPAETP